MRTLFALLFIAIAVPAWAQTHVQGYYRSNGTYVAPHYRSSPDASTYNNYSVKPNVNPYTGERGTRSPQPQYSPNSPYAAPGKDSPFAGSTWR